ncbi:hypothetical protein ABZ721_40530 [Streptomyces sp. NPDC006733]|uniref:hypothetical protein n=1 Tax=Streptomyces sp. NPDC006733 TaxID=3155460 RepID=UPI0033E39B4A
MLFGLPPRRTITHAWATTLLILPATGLAGCSLIRSSGKNCDGAEPRLTELAALTILNSRPPHTTPFTEYASVTTDCNDGSGGDAWLSAYRLYSFPGPPTDLFADYRQVAAADHWTEQQDTSPLAAPPRGGRHLLHPRRRR